MRPSHSRFWWQATVHRFQASGETALAFATAEGIDRKSLLWWRQRLNRDAAAESSRAAEPVLAPVFVEVVLAESPCEPVAVAAILASPKLAARIGQIHFEVAVGTDTAYLASLFAAVGRAVQPC